MRLIIWPAVLFVLLGVCARYVLGVWLPVSYIPDLFLVGVLIVALTEEYNGVFWLIAFIGAYVDLESSLLFGSYLFGFPFIFIMARYIFRRFVPSERVYIALPVAYIVSSIALLLWLFFVGAIAGLLGWPIIASISNFQVWPWFVGLMQGVVIALTVYILWLEVLHRTGKSVRLK